MSIKNMLEEAAIPLTLHELLERTLRADRPILPLDPDGDWIRASGVGRLCPREEVLAARNPAIKRTWKQPANLTLTFSVGTGVHWSFQRDVFSDAGAGILRGRWRCDECGALVGGGLSPEDVRLQASVREKGLRMSLEECDALRARCAAQLRPDALVPSPVPRPGEEYPQCPCCGLSTTYTYREMWFGDPDLGIGGSLDGIVELPWREGYGVLEMKTISEMGAWAVRTAPKPEHIDQAHVYMLLTGFKWALVVYIDKGTHGMGMLIPHEVAYSEEVASAVKMRSLITRAALRAPEAPLPGRICTARNCRRAKDCALSEVCFASP